MATFGTFVSGQILTAAELNSAGEWDSYTPTWTQSATITKTVNWARYMQLNKLVQVSVKMTASSAGTASNVIKVGLPVNASTDNYVMGTACYVSPSTGNINPFFVVYDSASTVGFITATGTSTALISATGSNLNLTVASNGIIYMNICYEAA